VSTVLSFAHVSVSEICQLLGYRAPLSYNLSVARELLKQVYIAERLQPPLSPQTWANAYTTLAQRATNPNYWREILNNGEYVKVGLYAVEAYTIFKVSSDLHDIKRWFRAGLQILIRNPFGCVFAYLLRTYSYSFFFRSAKSSVVGV
jgi:hypothetical protein